MEPMLGDNEEMLKLVAAVEPYVTNTIWLGKMNGGVSTQGLTPEEAARLERAKRILRVCQSNANIMALVSVLDNNPNVRWKDSIKKVIAASTKSAVDGQTGNISVNI